PLAAQPARAEVRAGLTAALAPRPNDGPPAVAAHIADDLVGGRKAEEVAAEQALRRQQQLLEGARHQVPLPPVYLSPRPPGLHGFHRRAHARVAPADSRSPR